MATSVQPNNVLKGCDSRQCDKAYMPQHTTVVAAATTGDDRAMPGAVVSPKEVSCIDP